MICDEICNPLPNENMPEKSITSDGKKEGGEKNESRNEEEDEEVRKIKLHIETDMKTNNI